MAYIRFHWGEGRVRQAAAAGKAHRAMGSPGSLTARKGSNFVGEAIELTDVVLRIIGAFYAFGGFVATRAGLMSQFIDQAIAAIALKKPTRTETVQNAWMIATAALVLIGGLLLLAGLQLAAFVFVASSLGQAAYLYYLAPRVFDRTNEPDARGRRASTNAFVIYAAATAFILWAAYRGRLVTLDEASTPALVAVGAGLLLYAGYLARALWWSPRKSRNSDEDATLDAFPEEPSLPPHESKRIKVMADYGCDPLWALDEERYGCFAPDMINLSPELSADLTAWAADFDTSFNAADPASGAWSDERYAAHTAEGRRLASRLKRERPDLMVYVMDTDIGVVEVHADD